MLSAILSGDHPVTTGARQAPHELTNRWLIAIALGITVIGLALNAVLEALEQRFMRWKKQPTDRRSKCRAVLPPRIPVRDSLSVLFELKPDDGSAWQQAPTCQDNSRAGSASPAAAFIHDEGLQGYP